jgi:hypothetical protein
MKMNEFQRSSDEYQSRQAGSLFALIMFIVGAILGFLAGYLMR